MPHCVDGAINCFCDRSGSIDRPRSPSTGIYNTTMLVSTKILRQYSDRTQVVREWRVVQVPEEDARTTDISTLFTRILDHVYDPLEPFRPLETDRDAPIRAEIGSSQNSTDFIFKVFPSPFALLMLFLSLASTSSSSSCAKMKRPRVCRLHKGGEMRLK